MAVMRNAPCPCGSGGKFKRCCGSRLQAQAAGARQDERIGRAAEEWAYAHFGHELTAAGNALLADLGASGANDWIVEHWVMLDYELSVGGTAAGRFAQLPALPSRDREIARRIAASSVGVHRALACAPGDTLDLRDVLGHDQTRVASANVSRDIQPGDLLLARVTRGSRASLWGPVYPLSPAAGQLLVSSLAELVPEDRRKALRCAWPYVMAGAPLASTTAGGIGARSLRRHAA